MPRPLVLIHGYSATGLDFTKLCGQLLAGKTIAPIDLNIGNYVSLNNEITLKDIAEGLDRAFRNTPALKDGQEFDAIVHSTGILVLRSWLTNYGAAVTSNTRLKRLKHLICLAPATWGSPQASKGRTWLGALIKGNHTPGPDFLNAGDEVLDALELGSRFTWDLAHQDLLGPDPFYDKGPDTPVVCTFIGNVPYQLADGLSVIADEPGTDGTVRWAGCGLNTRKIVIDLTRTPIGDDGHPASRMTITPWADDRLDIPLIAVDGRNHGTIVSHPDPGMVQLMLDFLKIGNPGAETFPDWLKRAQAYGADAKKKMLLDPGAHAASLAGQAKQFLGGLFHVAEPVIEGWQQFIVHARDERGDGVTDYLVEILHADATGNWTPFTQMYTDVHAYSTDQSYRCFHIRLPIGFSSGKVPLRVRIHASTGTTLIAYQGYSTDEARHQLTASAEPVDIDITSFGNGDTLFHPFTTTLIEIVLNREPSPLNSISDIFKWLAPPAENN